MTMPARCFASKDPFAEALFSKLNVSWTKRQIALDDIITDEATQVRRHDRTASVMQSYTRQMEQGALYPPVTVIDLDGKRARNVDGAGRGGAAGKVGLTSIPAYTLDKSTDPDLVVAISGALNGHHGEPMRADEKRIACVAGIRAGLTNGQITEFHGVSESQVKKYRAELACDDRSRKLGLDPAIVPITLKQRVGALQDDAVFTKLVQTIDKGGLGTDVVRDILGQVAQATSEADRLAAVGVAAKSAATQARAVANGSANCAGQASRVLGQVHALIGRCSDASAWVPLLEDERKIRRVKLDEVIEFLGKVAAEFDAYV